MDQLSNWSGVGDDITDETTSLIEDEVSDEEGEEVMIPKKKKGVEILFSTLKLEKMLWP